MARLPHPRRRKNQGQETFLAPSTNNQTYNHDRVLKQPFLPISTKVKENELYDEMVSCIHKFASKCHSQTIPSSEP